MRKLVVDSLNWIGQVLGFSSSSATPTPVSQVSPPVAETSCTNSTYSKSILSEVTGPQSVSSTSTFADSPLDTYAMYGTADNLLWMGGLIGLTLIGGLAYGLYCYYTTPPAEPLAPPAAIPEAPVSSVVQEPAPVLEEVAQENVQATPPQIIAEAPVSSVVQEPPQIISQLVLAQLSRAQAKVADDVDSILSKEAICQEINRLGSLGPGSDLELYGLTSIDIVYLGEQISSMFGLTEFCGERLQGTAQQIASVKPEEVAYYNAFVPELHQRLTYYYDCLVEFQQLSSTPQNACKPVLDALKQYLQDMGMFYEEMVTVNKLYYEVAMQLVEGGAPVVTLLEPCLGLSLSASLNLLLLRFTGSRRLSAPRVSLSLGGLGLSLATSTLLLSLGQPLLVALGVAVVLRLVVVLALRYRYAWFRQS